MIFITNKYTRIYYSIIEKARNRTLPEDVYTESHHIIPRCMGGSDDSTNLVRLTFKEHLFCHKLLVRMTEGSIRGKLSFAVLIMSKDKSNSRVLCKIKENARNYAREYNKGKLPITNGIVTKMLYKDEPMPEGFVPGWSDSYLKRKKGNNKGKVYITDGVKCRALSTGETVPEGWYYGQADYHKEKNRIANSGINNPNFGKRFITNGTSNQSIPVDADIPEGWRLGKVEKRSTKKSESKIGEKNPNYGKVPRNAIAVEIDGVLYNSAAEAQRAGYSRRTVENLYKQRKVNENEL